MKPYLNRGGDAGIVAYDFGLDWISVQFVGGKTYKYPVQHVGVKNLATMKRLAEAGDGLTTFISTHPRVKNGYLR